MSSEEGLDCLDLNTGGVLKPRINIGQRTRWVQAGSLDDELFFTSQKNGVFQLNRLALASGSLQSFKAEDYPYLHSSSVSVDALNQRLFLYNPGEAIAVDLAD